MNMAGSCGLSTPPSVEGEALPGADVALGDGDDVELGKPDSASFGAGLKLGLTSVPSTAVGPVVPPKEAVGPVVPPKELGLKEGSLNSPATGLDEGLIDGFARVGLVTVWDGNNATKKGGFVGCAAEEILAGFRTGGGIGSSIGVLIGAKSRGLALGNPLASGMALRLFGNSSAGPMVGTPVLLLPTMAEGAERGAAIGSCVKPAMTGGLTGGAFGITVEFGVPPAELTAGALVSPGVVALSGLPDGSPPTLSAGTGAAVSSDGIRVVAL